MAHNHAIHAIVKLPSNTFEKASLNTVAIVLEKTDLRSFRADDTATNIYQAYYNSKWSIKLVSSIALSNVLNGRWDDNTGLLAEDQTLQIFRGNISSRYFSETGDPILHCSSTFVNGSWTPGIRCCTGAPQGKYLEYGDIVINRIGRCAGYWTIYTGTRKLISDCLIVIKEPSDITIEILRTHSEKGRLNIPLRGVSTQYITLNDIKLLLVNH